MTVPGPSSADATCAALDPHALLAREMPWLQRLARGLTGEAAAGEDLAQETLLRALVAPAGSIREPRAWLRQVATRLWLRQRRRELVAGRAARQRSTPDQAPATDELVARTALLRDVIDALLATAEPMRSALILRYQEGLTPPDIAARLGVPLETVRTRLRRGLASLRARLDARPGGRLAWVACLLPSSLLPAAPSAAAIGSSSALLPALLMTVQTKLLLLSALAVAVALSIAFFPAEGDPRSPRASAEVAAAEERDRASVEGGRAKDSRPGERRVSAVDSRSNESPGSADDVAVDIVGVVVDEESGLPIASAELRLQRSPVAPREQQAAEEFDSPDAHVTSTGTDGRFQLRSLDRETAAWQLLIRSDQHALVTQRLGTPEPGDQAPNTPIRLDVGTIEVPPGTGVHGEVVNAGGEPVAGAALWVCRDPIWSVEGDRRMRLGRALAEGRADSAGRFRLTDRLCGRGPSHQPLLLAVGRRSFGCEQLAVGRSRAESEGNRVRLLPVATLRLRVVDEDGEALEGVDVRAEPRFAPIGQRAETPFSLGPLRELLTARTDASGIARMELPIPDGAVPDGAGTAPYLFRITGADRAELLVRDVLLEAGSVQDRRVQLATEQWADVVGRVLDERGRPVGEAEVTVRGARTVRVPVDARGQFAVRVAVRAARVEVQATALGFTRVHEELRVADEAVELECELRLERAAPLFGVVEDQFGEPVVGATVRVRGAEPDNVRSDGEGHFRIEGVPVLRRVRVDVAPPRGGVGFTGVRTYSLRVVDRAQSLRLERLADGRCDLDVEVVGNDGSALEIERVALTHLERSDGIQHPATPTLGRVRASGLRPGGWQLVILPERGPALAAQWQLMPGEERRELRLVQQLPGEVSLRIETAGVPAEQMQPVELACASPDQAVRFVLGDAAPVRDLRIPVGDQRAIRVLDAAPGRPLELVAQSGDRSARVVVNPVASGDNGEVVLRLRTRAILSFESSTPWDGASLVLFLKPESGVWGEPLRMDGLHGRQQLFEWPVVAGTFEWRIELPFTGRGDAEVPVVRAGRVEAAPGATVRIPVAGH